MGYQRKILRRMSPETRELAKQVNALEQAHKRLKAMVDNRYSQEKEWRLNLKRVLGPPPGLEMMKNDFWLPPIDKGQVESE